MHGVDQISGSAETRPALDELLAQLRTGDTVVIWRLDRLGRSLRHLIDVVGDLDRRGVALRSLTESVDIATPGGTLIFHVFGALAEFSARPHQRADQRWPGCSSSTRTSWWAADSVDPGEAGHSDGHAAERPAGRNCDREGAWREPSVCLPSAPCPGRGKRVRRPVRQKTAGPAGTSDRHAGRASTRGATEPTC